MVRNACDQLTVTCTKKGYVPANPGAGSIQDKSKGMAWGNVIFGGINCIVSFPIVILNILYNMEITIHIMHLVKDN